MRTESKILLVFIILGLGLLLFSIVRDIVGMGLYLQ